MNPEEAAFTLNRQYRNFFPMDRRLKSLLEKKKKKSQRKS